MIDLIITINKSDVFDEVQKTSEYMGSKQEAYEKISTQDEDSVMLQRYWREAESALLNIVKRYVSVCTMGSGLTYDSAETLSFTLSLPPNYDIVLNNGIQSACFSYIVNDILSKWLDTIGLKGDEYATKKLINQNDLQQKIFYRKKPTRP